MILSDLAHVPMWVWAIVLVAIHLQRRPEDFRYVLIVLACVAMVYSVPRHDRSLLMRRRSLMSRLLDRLLRSHRREQELVAEGDESNGLGDPEEDKEP